MALLGLLVVVVLAFAYLLTSRLNSAEGVTVANREHNAKVLNQAKQALIGWMVLNAAQDDNNPGRLPCPEGINNIGTTSEGIAAPTVTPSSPNCAVVGRLPWRTLGLDKLVDAASEPLWYVVSPGWALQNSSTLLTINSDSRGSLVVDGQPAPNNVVALIIAPGRAMEVAAAPGCAARSQTRAAPAPTIDARDYLECFNAGAATFSTTGPAASFNDQVLAVTTEDLIPALEAAIAHRMQREIAPAIRDAYASAQWGTAADNPVFPFAAPFGNPGSSNYQGTNGTYQGLLPLVYSETSTGSGVPCTGDPRCNPLFVTWTSGTLSGPSVLSPSCAVVSGTTTRLDCTFYYTCALLFCTPPNINYTIQAEVANVGMSLRQINMSAPMGSSNVTASLSSVTGVLHSNGSASLTLKGTMTPDGSGGFLSGLLGNLFCGLPVLSLILGCKESLISIPIGVLADHPVLDRNDATYGWFVRNEWHRMVYYAAAPQGTPSGLPAPYGCDSTDCLSINDAGKRNIRALLVLAGRSLTNPAGRPNGSLADYLEYQNCNLTAGVCNPQTLFEQRPVRTSHSAIPPLNAPFNDRIILIDWDRAQTAPDLPLEVLP